LFEIVKVGTKVADNVTDVEPVGTRHDLSVLDLDLLEKRLEHIHTLDNVNGSLRS
jgi:hypothetical protein